MSSELMTLEQVDFDGQTKSTVNARELHEFLESKRQFANWIQEQIEVYGFVEGEDFLTNLLKTTNGGRPRIEYHITIDMAKELSMVERNEKGKQARQYFIACERRLQQPQFDLPKTFSDALRLAADLQYQVEILGPKAAALDLLSDRTNTMNFRLTAKHLKVKEPVLKAKLMDLGWIVPKSRPMTITAKASDGGFMIQNTGIADNDHQYSQALITSKGLAKLAEYFSQYKIEKGSCTPSKANATTQTLIQA